MSQRKHFLISLILFISAFYLTGCASTPSRKTSILNGIVYNLDNEPVSGASIYIDEKKEAVTDIYGHFSITGLILGEYYTVTIKKDLYEEAKVNFTYANISQVIYVKITSVQQLLNQAENEIKKKNYGKAETLLLRAENVSSENYSCMYLLAIVKYFKSDYTEAINILDKLLEVKKESYVYLLLADCYQYGLNDMENAKKNLKAFLDIEFSQKIYDRYSSL